MLKDYYVYIHTFNNGTKYIGKGKDKRAFMWTSRNKYWNNIYNKYGIPRVHIVKNGLLEREALDLEIMIIEILKNVNIPICNITSGGEGQSGMTGIKSFWFGKSRDIVTRNKISIALSGKNHPNFGTQLSQSTKDKIGIKHTGKVISEGTRKLLSKKGKERRLEGTNNPSYNSTKYLFTHPTYGEILSTQYDLYTTYNLTKSAVCCIIAKTRHSHKGWRLS